MSVLKIPEGARAVHLGGLRAKGRVALVDEADYEIVSYFSWYCYEWTRPTGTICGPWAQTSIRRGDKQATLGMHTLLTGYPMTDHENRNGLDNRRSNLRSATVLQNLANIPKSKRPGLTSQYKGVRRTHLSPNWEAGIRVNGKPVYLGTFSTEEKAARAYDSAARDTFGEFAHCNFPPRHLLLTPAQEVALVILDAEIRRPPAVPDPHDRVIRILRAALQAAGGEHAA
jgi:hypothetical protein